RSGEARCVCQQFPNLTYLSDCDGQERIVAALLEAMRKQTGKPPSPGVLGLVGGDHYRACFEKWFGVERFWYRKGALLSDGAPVRPEVARTRDARPGGLSQGVIFPPYFGARYAATPLAARDCAGFGVGAFLEAAHVHPHGMFGRHSPAGSAVAVHLISPSL